MTALRYKLYFDVYRDEEFLNSVRKLDLDTKTCIVPLTFNHGAKYVLISFTGCPYLKNGDVSQGISRGQALWWRPAHSHANPASAGPPRGSIPDRLTFEEGLLAAEVVSLVQTVTTCNDSSAGTGTEFGDSSGQASASPRGTPPSPEASANLGFA